MVRRTLLIAALVAGMIFSSGVWADQIIPDIPMMLTPPPHHSIQRLPLPSDEPSIAVPAPGLETGIGLRDLPTAPPRMNPVHLPTGGWPCVIRTGTRMLMRLMLNGN